jgi:hypothetical protein
MNWRFVRALPLVACLFPPAEAAGLRNFTQEVFFSKGETTLVPSEGQQVQDLAAALKALPGCVSIVVLTGYADRTEGDKDERRAISEDRARHIAGKLKQFGPWQTSAISGDYRDTPFAKGWRGRVLADAVYRHLAPCQEPVR